MLLNFIYHQQLPPIFPRMMKPSLDVISDTTIEQILFEAKRVLNEVGVEVRGRILNGILQDSGLKIQKESARILFPTDVVDRALAEVPRFFTLFNRHGDAYAEIGGDNIHFTPGSSGLYVLDFRTGETRHATTKDFVEYVHIADGLRNISFISTAFSTDDVSVEVADAWRLYLCLTNTLRPVVTGAFTEFGVPLMVEMLQLFRSDQQDLIERPMAIFTITPSGAFRYGEASCQNLVDCVTRGIPIEIVPVTLMGLTAPVTPLGAAVFHVADVLAGLTMAQIIRPGAPLLFGGAPASFHMKTATSPMAAIEAQRLNTLYIAVAKALDLPCQAYMALSDSKRLDAQAGAETFGSALLAALAGVNSISGPGMLDYVLTFSPEKLVFDDEMCGQAFHFIRDIHPLEDIPTIDLARRFINEKHVMTMDHTLKYWSRELYLPHDVIDRTNRENWVDAGSPSLEQRAHLEVEKMLSTYQPVPTDSTIDHELRRLIGAEVKGGTPLPDVLF